MEKNEARVRAQRVSDDDERSTTMGGTYPATISEPWRRQGSGCAKIVSRCSQHRHEGDVRLTRVQTKTRPVQCAGQVNRSG